MTGGRGGPVSCRLCGVAFSVLASSLVWLAVVKGIGYSALAGFFYFLGYFAAMLLLLKALGYPFFGSGNE